MLQAINLVKSFKSRIVVDGVSIQVKQGQIVGLLGPNGAGKTTTFYMISGLIKVDSGQIIYNGCDLTHMAMHKRASLGLGYLPQEPSVFRRMTVRDNILTILEFRKDLDKNKRLLEVDSLMQRFQITSIADMLGEKLSGGERRRVEIARSLAINPKLLLFDEPFAGIDPISVVELKKIMKQLAQSGIAVLITDHNVRETLDICHSAYILNHGKVIASGNSAEITDNKLVRQVYLGDEFAI